jgi:hypothetical protein
MRLIDADALKDFINEVCFSKKWTKYRVDNGSRGQIECILTYIDNAPTVERPQYILKAKNLTAENKKHFQECWNKSAGGLLAIPDNYEIIPIERQQGEWKIGGSTTHYHYCSICGKDVDLQDNFCRSCGARMKGGAE